MMNCPNCNSILPDAARFCDLCGSIVTKYMPPEGFEIDPESLLFYRSDRGNDPDTGAPVQWVTWFDPNTGEYRQVSYPVEAQPEPEALPLPEEPEPEPEPVSEPVPEPVPVHTIVDEPAQQPEPQPQAPIPEGFTYDSNSGVCYITTPGTDPATGAAGNWYTWFYPSNGEYKQVFYPAETVPQSPRKPDRRKASEPVRRISVKPGSNGKSKTRILLVLLPLFALLGGSAFAFWQAGGLQLFTKPADATIPAGIVIMSPDPANAPVFLPMDNIASPNGSTPDSSAGQTGTDASESASPPYEAEPEEASAQNSWGAIYANYLKMQSFGTKEFMFFQDMCAFPVHAPAGETLAVMEATFYEIEGFDYPVMVLTEFFSLESDPRNLDTYPFDVAYLIKDGVVTYEKTPEEEAMTIAVYEESGMSYINGVCIASFNLYVNQTGAQGRETVEANFQYLYDWLDQY